jgi:hypothetical protein
MSEPVPPRLPPQPVPYATPSADARSLFHWPAAAAMATPIGLLLAGSFVVPKLEQLFRDFAVRLPAATSFVLGLYRTGSGLRLALMVLAGVAAAAGFLCGLPLAGAAADDVVRRRRGWATRLCALIGILISAAFLLSLLVPLISLTSSVGGGGAKGR